jgi:glycine hydroxymethyltransferase
MGEAEMAQIAALIDRLLAAPEDADVISSVRGDVRELAARFPLYPVGVAAGH